MGRCRQREQYGNTFLGRESGRSADVNASVFLGYKAGYSATRNNTLYIENSDSDTPLIYGEFDTNLVRVNGNFEFTGIMNAPLVVNDTVQALAVETYELNASAVNTDGTISAIYEGDSGVNVERLLFLGSNNTNPAKNSDAGFLMRNAREGFTWLYQTYEPKKGFLINKEGSGAAEMIVTGVDSAGGMQLILGNGAKNSGGQWLDASSREYKENIKALGADAAMEAFSKLQPVTYNYKTNKEENVIGFVAEDVPDIAAPNDHKSLSALEIAALLTKVVQEQKAEIAVLKEKAEQFDTLEAKVRRLESLFAHLGIDPSVTAENKPSLSLK